MPVILGHLATVKTAQHEEKLVNTAASVKILRKSAKKNPLKPKPRVNNVEDVSSEAARVGTSATAEEQVKEIDYMLKKHNIFDANAMTPLQLRQSRRELRCSHHK